MEPIHSTIEDSREGVPTLIIYDTNGKKVYLHSAVRPSREADSLREELASSPDGLLIVLGVGLGYHLHSLAGSRTPDRPAVLIERLPDIERHLEAVPGSRFLSGTDGITILAGIEPDTLASTLDGIIDFSRIGSLRLVEHPASMRAFGDYYRAIRSVIEALVRKKAGDAAARRAFGYRYLKNALINCGSLGSLTPVSALFERFTGRPALVVMPGPSLDGALDEVRAYARRAVVIAADSALPVLSAAGIDVHFCVSIDPQGYTWEHCGRMPDPAPVMVCSLTANPRLIRRGDALLSLNSHPIAQLIDQLCPDAIGSIDSTTGNVAGDAVYFAHLLGCAPIGIVGFDSCFSRYRIYARGSAYQNRFARLFHDRFQPIETQNLRYIRVSSRAYREQGRFTRRSFTAYNATLARFIAARRIGGIAHVNPDGLPIEGVPAADLAAIMAHAAPVTDDLRALIAGCIASAPSLADLVDVAAIRRALVVPENADAVLRASLDDKTLVKRGPAITGIMTRLLGGGR